MSAERITTPAEIAELAAGNPAVARFLTLAHLESTLILRTARKPWACRSCGTELPPGTRHIEYVGEAFAYASGKRYCLSCAAAEWMGYLEERLAEADEREAASWVELAHLLGARMENHAFCTDHPESDPVDACPFCQDRAAYRAYEAKAGAAPDPFPNARGVPVHELARSDRLRLPGQDGA